MESHDSYPVFHTRLTRTYRRRLTRPDGTSTGWLIATGDHFIEVVPGTGEGDDGPSPVTASPSR